MKCAHAGCNCTNATVDRDGKKYCSTQCASGGGSMAGSSGGCGCGHAGCTSPSEKR